MTVTSLLPTSTNPPSTNVQMLVSVLVPPATPRRWTSPAPRRPIKGAWPAAMPRLPSSRGRDTPSAFVSRTVCSGVTMTQRMSFSDVVVAMMLLVGI